MDQDFSKSYCPTLRMKAGELAGVRDLATDVASSIIPLFVVPPCSERDPNQPTLSLVKDVPDVSAVLSRNWRDRLAFIDAAYLVEEFGHSSMRIWLPAMIDRARRSSIRAIPVASIRGISSIDIEAFAAATANSDDQIKLGLRVSYEDVVASSLKRKVDRILSAMSLTPEQCSVIADFSEAEFSDPSIVAPIIAATLDNLQEMGSWLQMIFQGTNYPEYNPAVAGSHEVWPRNEWIAWRQAVRLERATARHLLFGDYAADCAKMNFGSAVARAIRHYRYTIADAWLIERGDRIGTDRAIMQQVCKNIIGSKHFSGADFSTADSYIWRTAVFGDGPGNATTWRQINTTHHITRVVADIALVRGFSVPKKTAAPQEVQSLLL